MKKYRLLILCSFFFMALQHTDAQLDSLKNLGHASMKIKTSDGKIIYIDPYGGTAADYSDSADILLVSHSHSDHNNQGLVKLKSGGTKFTYVEANVSGSLKSITVGSVKIDAVAAYNANHSKTSCVGYVLEFNGIKLYHAGDTGKISEMADLAARGLTYALLPLDSIYTMSPKDATDAAAMITAKQYIPIHTMPPPDTYSDDKVSRFNVSNKIIVKNGQSISLNSNPVSVNDVPPSSPLDFALEQNYPNPFNPSTMIRFTIPVSGFTSLKVFDLLGNEVAILVNKELSTGNHSYEWSDVRLPSGIYFYRLNSGPFSQIKKLVLLK